jgi:hypothetical protein
MTILTAAKGVVVVDGATSRAETGFEPRAVVLWWTRQREPGVVSGNAGGIGFYADGAAASVAWAAAEATAPTATARRAAEAAVLGIDAVTGEAGLRAQLVCDAAGFSLETVPPPVEPWTVHYLAVGGAVDGIIGWLSSATAPTRQHVTLALRPDLVLLAPVAVAAFDVSERGLVAAVGAAAGARAAGASFNSEDAARPGAVAGMQLADAAVSVPASRDDVAAAARVHATDDGFDVDWSRAWPTPHQFPYLAVEGIRCRVGVDRSPPAPGTSRTRVGFRPEALLLFTWGLGARPYPSDIGRLCIGGATKDAAGCAGWDERDVEAPTTSTHVCSSNDHVVLVTNTQTGDVHASAALRSLDRNGFTLEWDRSDGPQREFAYVALAARRRRVLRGHRHRSASSRGS